MKSQQVTNIKPIETFQIFTKDNIYLTLIYIERNNGTYERQQTYYGQMDQPTKSDERTRSNIDETMYRTHLAYAQAPMDKTLNKTWSMLHLWNGNHRQACLTPIQLLQLGGWLHRLAMYGWRKVIGYPVGNNAHTQKKVWIKLINGAEGTIILR